MDVQPPKWAVRFLEYTCANDFLDELQGDLLELFYRDHKKIGLKRARKRFAIKALLSPRWYRLPKLNQLQPIMLHPIHFKVALRNLKKSFSYSLINILGLSLGMAACLLVLAYTWYEGTYDKNHPNLENAYRVNQTNIWDPDGGIMSSTVPPLAAALEDNFPEIEAVTRINTPGGKLVRHVKEDGTVLTFNEWDVLAADSNFFDFFAFKLKEGNPETALKGFGKAVISNDMAVKYFGDQPALGQTIEMGEDRLPVEITGVTYPQPENTHFDFDFMLSMPTNRNVKKMDWNWIWTQVVTYVHLNPNTDPDALEAKFPLITEQHVKPTFARYGMDFDDFMKGKEGWNFHLQPIRDIHLHSNDIGNRIGIVGNITMVRMMRVIAFFILLIAVFNFINLSTARASTRAREIGVKKAMGAERSNLIIQFLIESVVITLIAATLSLGMIYGLRSLIDNSSGIEIPLNLFFQPSMISIIIAFPFLVGILAGLYPAFFLSGFEPIKVLKGNLSAGGRNPILRNVLVTAQFTIAIALMAGSLLVFQQTQFLMNKDLGYNQENILVINSADRLNDQLNSFRDQVRNYPEVAHASIAMDMPGRGTYEDLYTREGSDIKISISQVKIDPYYFPTMEFDVAAGRIFDKDRPGDINGVVVNETTARLFELENEEAIGKRIIYPGFTNKMEIIGVVKDFHFQAFRDGIAPMMFVHIDSEMWGDNRVLAIKYTQEEEEKLLAKLERDWDMMTDNLPFEYSFYDEELRWFYDSERRLAGLVSTFTGFSLFIAIIGLIGLLSFFIEKRKKEIGVRKVLGASKIQLFTLLNKQYLKLFLLALVLAVPLSWQAMQGWLNSFAYRIDISILVYMLAGGIVILLSILSASFLGLKIAAINPAKVLKDE